MSVLKMWAVTFQVPSSFFQVTTDLPGIGMGLL